MILIHTFSKFFLQFKLTIQILTIYLRMNKKEILLSNEHEI